MKTAVERGLDLAGMMPDERPAIAQMFLESETRPFGMNALARYARIMEGLPFPDISQKLVDEDRRWFENLFRKLGWGVYNVDGRPQVQPVDDDKCSDETAWMLAKMYGMEIDDQGYVIQES